MTTGTEDFKRDIANHQMHVIRDDGVNRHIRFKRPGTGCMHFDLITWPGYLCYTGDMGTYVFARLEDMFVFFRRRIVDTPYRMDKHYWAEKVQAQDRDGITEYSPECFKANIKDHLQSYCDGMSDDERAELTAEVKSDVLDWNADESEHEAVKAAMNFTFNGKHVFEDFWHYDNKAYTHRFEWCCHALEWAIDTYDMAKAAQAEKSL